MDNGKQVVVLDNATVMKLVVGGDTSGLDQAQKLAYYKARCDAANIDYRTAPFQFLRLQGREVLYATKGATDQLAAAHGVRVEILSQATEGGVRVVVVRSVAKDGRQTDEIGVVPVGGLAGAELANAYMKAVTKAKRRAILSICGLGMMDEAELDTVQGAVKAPIEVETGDQTVQPPVNTAPASDGGKTAHGVLVPGRKITVPQAKRFFAIAKSAGKSDGEIKAYLQDTLGIERSADMNLSDYEKAVEWAQTIPANTETLVNEDTGEVIG